MFARKDEPLKVVVVDGRLEITIGVDTLVFCETERQKWYEGEHKEKITNNEGFVKDVAHELCREEEDGTTPLHLLLDKMIEAAKDSGSEHVEYPE